MWYECKIKYSRIDEDDRVKTFNQPYLFDAMSFTEAEARVNEEMVQYISTEFNDKIIIAFRGTSCNSEIFSGFHFLKEKLGED